MAETLTSILTLQIDSFLASLQQASQAVAAFATSLSGGLAGSAAVFQQQIQQINQVADATRKTSDTVRNTKKTEVAELKSANEELHQQYVAIAQFETKMVQDVGAAKSAQLKNDLAQEKATSDALMKLLAERVATETAQLKALEQVQAQFFQNTLGMAKQRQQSEEQLQRTFLGVTQQIEKQRLDAMATLQAQFFRITNAMWTEQVANAKKTVDAESQATAAAYKYRQEVQNEFFRATNAMWARQDADETRRAAERVTTERRTAADILAIWQKAGADIDHMEAAAAQRRDLRFQARTTLANVQANAAIASITGGPLAAPMASGDTSLLNPINLLQGYINLLEKATPPATAFENAIARIGTSFRTLGGYLVAGAIIRIPFELAQWGKEAVDTAVKMQSLQATFAAIAGSAAAGQRELDFVRRTAQRAGVDFLEAAQSFKSLEAAARGTKLEGEGVRRIFEQVTNAARVMGLSSEQVSRMLLALEQMISRGTVSAEELRKQLGNALPGAVQIMSRALGVTTQELGDLMKNADLLAVDVLPRFGAQLQREFGPGFTAAAESAQATFARFGNNVRDISVNVGNAILTILKPVVDTINKGFELYQKAKDAADQARNAGVGAEPPRLGTIEGRDLQKQIENARQLLIDEQDVLREMNVAGTRGLPQESIDAQVELVKKLTKAYEDLVKRRETYLQQQEDIAGSAGVAATDVPFARQTEAIKKTIKDLDDGMAGLNIRKKLVPSILGEDADIRRAREEVRLLEKAIQDLTDTVGKTGAGKQGQVPENIAKELGGLLDRYHAAESALKSLEDAKDAAREKEQEDERRRKRLIAEQKQLDEERIRLEEKMSLAVTNATQGETEKKLAALELMLADAKRTHADETLTARFEAAERERIYAEEAAESLRVNATKLNAIKARVTEQIRLEHLITSVEASATKTRIDDAEEDLQKRREQMQEGIDAGIKDIEDMNRLEAAGAKRHFRILQEEQDKLNKEAAKSWRELGNTIEGILASTFQNVLSGSKNLFQGIRDAFLSLLAKLAADALTNAIIIPVIMRTFGAGGGGGGMATSGTLPTTWEAYGAMSAAGAFGGGGAGDALGTAVGLATSVNSISGAMGGPTIGLGSGGFGASLAATEIGRLPLVGGLFGGPGAGAAGPTTAIGAATVGQIVGGVGAGIATGMILSKINQLMGFHGTGSAVAAGAGGGATAGALIGSVIPVIGTGIGAAIGTAVGALGGFLSTLFGGGKQPGFKIQDLQPGQIAYDENIGLRVQQNFKILDDFHQKLGVDYEDFIKLTEDGFNELFQSTISQLSGATPQVQKALVDPLNDAFRRIADQIEQYQEIGGEDFKKKFETMMGTDIPKIFADAANGAIGKFVEAVKKVDPVIQAFNTIIDSIMQDIDALHEQQLALNASLEGNITTLRESLMTPAELLRVRQETFQTLLGRFNTGNEADKILLAPVIGQLSTEIFGLAKTVFETQSQQFNATGIAQAIKSLEESLFTPEQTLGARRTDLDMLMAQFRAGDDTIKAGLTPQITALAQQIMELTKGVNQLAEAQALMADFPGQLRAITEAFYTPAQSYLSMRDQLDVLMTEFRGGTAARRIELEPQIAQFAAQILQVARGQDVLGQDPQLMRNVQQEMLTLVKEMQAVISGEAQSASNNQASVQAVLERTQGEMISVLREVQNGMINSIVNNGANIMNALFMTSGQIIGTDHYLTGQMINATYQTTNGVINAQYTMGGQFVGAQYSTASGIVAAVGGNTNQTANLNNTLWYTQQVLIGQVQGVQSVAWATYNGLAQVLWAEVGLAQTQINLLVGSLYHLETVDAVVQAALGQLGAMNWRLGNPLQVSMGESLMTQLQRDSNWWAQQQYHLIGNSNRTIIALLAKPAFGLGWDQGQQLGRDVVGFQHGGFVPRNMFAQLHAGEQVIPEYENRHNARGRGTTVHINVYGGNKDVTQIADAVMDRIETKSGRLQSSRIQTGGRR